MEEFLAYSPEDVIGANLSECDLRLDMICEQETAHLHELAAELASGGTADPDFFRSLHDHRPQATPLDTDALQQNAHALHAHRSMLTVWKSVTLCRELHRLLVKERQLRPEDFFGEPEELPEAASGRVVYQRNGYADLAYLRFSACIEASRALYAHSFSAVCDQIYNGSCEFGILPVESSADGPLNSVLHLIDRYGLAVAATLDVPTTDGSRTTRFALLRRELRPLFEERGHARLFELSVASDSSPSVAELLCAAQGCGLKLLRTDTRPMQMRDGKSAVRMVFASLGDELYTYLLYLAMEAPHYTPIGIYSHLADRPDSHKRY